MLNPITRLGVAMRTVSTTLFSLSLFAFSFSFVACTSNTDPTTAGYWVDRLDDRNQTIKALKELGKIGDKTSVPAVTEWFEKEGKWQPDAAYTLGLLGDPASIPVLVGGLDLKVGAGRDKLSRIRNRTNRNIARALALLKAKDAAPQLMPLLTAPELKTVEAVMHALGHLGDPRATEALIERVLTEPQPFIRKTAIQSLGDLGDPKAVPALTQALYFEVPGISFYNEAGYSLIQMGDAAIPHLVKTLKRENKEVEEIRMSNGDPIAEGAIEAKATFVLSALRATKTEADVLTVLDKLYGEFAASSIDNPIHASVPGAIITMTYAIANLGTAKSGTLLKKIVLDEDARVRMAAAESLAALGIKDAVPTLFTAVKSGDLTARQAAVVAISRLGNESNIAAFKAIPTSAPKAAVPACTKMVAAEISRLEAAKECKKDVACWVTKLEDKSRKVRERAAYELGWAGSKENLPALYKAAEDDDPDARMAATIALGQLDGVDHTKLQAIHDKWKTKIDYRLANNELKQMIARLKANGKTAKKAG